MKDFTLHDRVPLAVPEIAGKEARLVLRSEVVDGKYYGAEQEQVEESQGLISYLGAKLYENTVGYYFGGEPEEESGAQEYDREFVDVEMLDKMATAIQRLAEESFQSKGEAIVEESQLRKLIRKALSDNQFTEIEENIDLLLSHLKWTGRLATGAITVTGKSNIKIVKLAPVGVNLYSKQISAEEKAPFQIQELLSQIDKDIETKTQLVGNMNAQCIKLMKANERKQASKMLTQRKGVEKYIVDLTNKKFNLEGILMGIEQGQQNQMMFESLKVASEAGKIIN